MLRGMIYGTENATMDRTAEGGDGLVINQGRSGHCGRMLAELLATV